MDEEESEDEDFGSDAEEEEVSDELEYHHGDAEPIEEDPILESGPSEEISIVSDDEDNDGDQIESKKRRRPKKSSSSPVRKKARN